MLQRRVKYLFRTKKKVCPEKLARCGGEAALHVECLPILRAVKPGEEARFIGLGLEAWGQKPYSLTCVESPDFT